MARYIDADKMVAKDNAYTTFPHDLAVCDDTDLVRWINEQPTADVAPKSEVAEIFAEIEKIRAKEIHRCEVMREKEKDAAERKYWEGGEHALLQLSYWFAELKKIHTNN